SLVGVGEGREGPAEQVGVEGDRGVWVVGGDLEPSKGVGGVGHGLTLRQSGDSPVSVFRELLEGERPSLVVLDAVVSDRLEERARAGFDGVDAIEAEPAFVLAQAAPSRDVGAVGAQYHLVGLDLPYCFA